MKLYLISFTKHFHNPVIVRDKKYECLKGFYLCLNNGDRVYQSEISHIPEFHTQDLDTHLAKLPQYLNLFKKSCAESSFEALDKLALPKNLDLSLGVLIHQYYSLPHNRLSSYTFGNIKDLKNTSTHKPIKLKLEPDDLKDDIQNIKEFIHNNDNALFRFDMNQKFTKSEFDELLSQIPLKNIEYFEEPVNQINELKNIIKKKSFNIALDENIDLFLKDSMIPHSLILKPSLLGFSKTQEIINKAKQNKIKVILSSSYETQVGLSAMGVFDIDINLYHGLDTHKLISHIKYDYIKNSDY